MIDALHALDSAVLRTTKTADGRLDTQIKGPSGGWVRLHSLHDPEAEASRLIDSALQGGQVPPVVGVLGVGLGHVVDELERRRPDVRIVAIELTPALAGVGQRRQDWDTAIRSGRLVLGEPPDYELPTVSWPAAALSSPPLVVVHPVLGRLFPTALEHARKALTQFLFEQRANADARRRLAGLYFYNTVDNLPALVAASDIGALDGAAAGRPLVLCGAGPSLTRLIPDLLAIRERAWIVALDTALRPLLAGGLVPDLVVSIDPTAVNGRHLINLPTRARPWLVSEASVDPRVLATFAGRTFVCRIGRAEPWPWLEQFDVNPSRLQVWGSVLTAGCDLAKRLQASPVAFAGIDLSFTNGQPYCRGTAFEEDWRTQQARDVLPSVEAVWQARLAAEDLREEPDVNDRPVSTVSHMVAFRNWVRSFVASTGDREFVNVTGAGILHGAGIAQSTLVRVFSAPFGYSNAASSIRGAARASFADRAPHLTAAIADLGLDRGANPIYHHWADQIHEFDETRARQLFRHASARLRSRKGATVPIGESGWIDVPYDSANFEAKPELRWSVSESNVATYAYQVIGKTMTLAFKINHSTLDGRPANELWLRIPGNYLPARGMANPIWLCSHSGKECGYATVHPGLEFVVLLRATEEHFPIELGNFFAFGQLTFEVQ